MQTQWPEATFRVKVRPKAPAIPEGFIPHDGGHCPVAEGVSGYLLMRSGASGEAGMFLSAYRWSHKDNSADIIAYKPERPPGFKVEAGKFYITASGERVGPMRMSVYDAAFYWAGKGKQLLWKHDGDRVNRAGAAHDLLCLAADQTSPAGGTK